MGAGKKQEDIDIKEMIALEQELHDLKVAQGIETEGKVSKKISRFLEKREAAKESHPVNRKKYIWLAVLTGWFGGHRFYAKRYGVALLYLLLFWTGFPLAMAIIDVLIAIPKLPDENGMITL